MDKSSNFLPLQACGEMYLVRQKDIFSSSEECMLVAEKVSQTINTRKETSEKHKTINVSPAQGYLV